VRIPLLLKNKPLSVRFKLKSHPLAVFERLYKDEGTSFLYESLESCGERGRYSFIGAKPLCVFKSKGKNMEINVNDRIFIKEGNPIDFLRVLLSVDMELPNTVFPGGAIGYIAYDAVRFFEDIPDNNIDDLSFPDFYLIVPAEIIIFDHKEDIVDVILYDRKNQGRRQEEIRSVVETCSEDVIFQPYKLNGPLPFDSNFTKDNYEEIVSKAKEYIYAGDIFQVVLSQRFKCHIIASPILIYQALRITNPSPYMYYLKLDDLYVLGSSPEVLVKLQDRIATTRPLAGTRPRGETEKEDSSLEKDLLKDEKELAEHIMLVDLARNDIGRVCEYGSVKTTELLQIERYSKVMHLVSNVVGKLKKDKDAFDLLCATFPAGTVSGAPKIRAMELIDELEPSKRGIYAGTIGYFTYAGNMDMCIAIRTVVLKKGIGYIQAGAGVVADSVPEREYIETLNKASALKRAIEIAR
jgi:anthranilate synthase component 1